jgi:hypothetical protein
MFGAILWSLFFRAAVALFARNVREREPRDVRRIDHLRIEALQAVVLGLSFVNVFYGVCLQSRHLFMALRSGDRFQVMRAAGIEALDAAAAGGPVGARERHYAALVERMASQIDHEDVGAFREGMQAIRLFFHGAWREAGDALVAVQERYAARQAGWYMNAQLFGAYAFLIRGQLIEFRHHHAALFAQAQEWGDVYTTVNLRIGHTSMVWLLDDEPEVARRNVREAMAAWPRRGFSLQVYRVMLAEANIDLYLGDGRAAYERVVGQWWALRRSLLMQVQYLRADAWFLRGRCALAVGRLAEAARFARKLEKERTPWTSALAAIIRASEAFARGARAETEAHLRVALERSEAADMRLHAAVVRLRLGALTRGGQRESDGEPSAEDFAARGMAWMTDQGIVRADRIAAMLAPGLE